MHHDPTLSSPPKSHSGMPAHQREMQDSLRRYAVLQRELARSSAEFLCATDDSTLARVITDTLERVGSDAGGRGPAVASRP